MKEVSGIDSQYRVCNRLTLAFDQQAADHAKQSLEWQAKVPDFNAQWLDPAQALEVEPRVNPACLGGALVQGAGSVEPYRYTLAAAQAGEKLGVEMALRKVTGLLTQGERCSGVTFEGGQMLADAVVLAMGPWTEGASSWCQTPIPVTPLKGQILRLQLAGEPLLTSLHWAGSYASSKLDGMVLGGHHRRASRFRRGYNYLGQRQNNGRPASDGAVPEQRATGSTDRLPAALVARRFANRGESARLAKPLFGHWSRPQGHTLEHRHEPGSGRCNSSWNQPGPRPDLSGPWTIPESLTKERLFSLGRYRNRTLAQVPGLPKAVNTMVLLSEASKALDTSTLIGAVCSSIETWNR